MSQEAQFIKLFVAAEQRFMGYLVTLVPHTGDAEELMQEAGIVMWEKFGEFLKTQEGEPDIGRFVAWGCKIAFFKVLNKRRKKQLNCRILSEDIVQLISDEWISQQESQELEDRRRALSQCIEKLPDSRRAIIRDYYWDGLTVNQLASKYEQSKESIYKSLQRIRATLHKCIDGKMSQQA